MKKKYRKISVITGSRAEFGLLKPVIEKLSDCNSVKVSLVAAGMHLSEDFGYTLNEVSKYFKVDYKVEMTPDDDTNIEMVRAISKGLNGFAKAFKKMNPDIVVLLGDRIEPFAAAIAAGWLNIFIAHIHGGEVTKGGLDECIRHSITRFAHFHFASTKKSYQRLIQMGENPEFVFLTGAPGLDSVLNTKIASQPLLEKKFNINLEKQTLIVIQHPVTTQTSSARKQMFETMEAVKSLKTQTVVIYPNSDAGGRSMIDVIESYRKYDFIKIFKNIEHTDFISLMRYASCIVGNSSCAIIEAPSFKLPAVNIGIRQEGREQATNVINVSHNRKGIKSAIKKAISKSFEDSLKTCKNPYGDGKASLRISKILSTIKLTKKILQKKICI